VAKTSGRMPRSRLTDSLLVASNTPSAAAASRLACGHRLIFGCPSQHQIINRGRPRLPAGPGAPTRQVTIYDCSTRVAISMTGFCKAVFRAESRYRGSPVSGNPHRRWPCSSLGSAASALSLIPSFCRLGRLQCPSRL
jgi:hypothetical protein